MKNLILLFLVLISSGLPLFSQSSKTRFGKGIYLMAPDSSMDVVFSARFQTLFDFSQTLLDGKLLDDFEGKMMIRRARLKFDGFVFNPRIKYKFELGLSNRDIGLGKPGNDNRNFNTASNIVFDAVLKYKYGKKAEIWIGQTKLPGNRERVISSRALQFVDRSLVNAYYNLDRDVGIQWRHKFQIGKMEIRELAAISLGEGRNVTSATNNGFGYTARLEFLPFGTFKSKGDYFGSDLEREQTPKLSIGLVYDYNDEAVRSHGRLGSFLSAPRDLETFQADLMFKYKGFSVESEYSMRETDDPVVLQDTLTGKVEAFVTGQGISVQGGYLLPSNYEIAARCTYIDAEDETPGLRDETMYTLCVSKYIVKHSLKIQSDFSVREREGSDALDLGFRFQVEMQF
jgi:phosphate-selective porin OprO and OprP